MSDATRERVSLIRKTWRSVRVNWPKGSHEMRVALPPKNEILPYTGTPTVTANYDRLVYRRERGYLDGKPAYRILCEGVEVEAGPE